MSRLIFCTSSQVARAARFNASPDPRPPRIEYTPAHLRIGAYARDRTNRVLFRRRNRPWSRLIPRHIFKGSQC